MNLKLENFLIVMIILLLVGQNSSPAGETLFHEGVAHYETGEYEIAAQAFKNSLAKQPAAGTLLNLGLAEWQRGQTGPAILAWEQAAWMDPLHPAARQNLAYVREMTSISPLDMNWCEQVSIWLPANCWAWIMGISLWLAMAMVTLPGFFRMRKAGWHQTLAALGLGIFILSIPSYIGVITRSNIGIVIQKNTALRLTPTEAAEAVTTLPAGEPVRQLRMRGNYFLVRTQYGSGWVTREQIEFVCPR